jgi:hypothetical protein
MKTPVTVAMRARNDMPLLSQSSGALASQKASFAYHSHDYTNEQWCKRQFGEGKAEAVIFQFFQ